jgi:hypothetical protein
MTEISTSIAQSNTLLSWGISKYTADMFWLVTSKPHLHILGDEDLSNYDRWENYPAWSFPKLFAMLPCLETKCRVDHPMLHKLEHGNSCVYWINYKYKRIHTDFCKSPIEAVVSMIKLLINKGYRI